MASADSCPPSCIQGDHSCKLVPRSPEEVYTTSGYSFVVVIAETSVMFFINQSSHCFHKIVPFYLKDKSLESLKIVCGKFYFLSYYNAAISLYTCVARFVNVIETKQFGLSQYNTLFIHH